MRRVVLELFAGSGRLTEAVKRRALAGLDLDLRHGAAEDHLRSAFKDTLKGWLGSRVAGAVWLGTPCTTWTQALRSPLRTRARPMGLPGLLPHEREKLRIGNRPFNMSCDVIEICIQNGIPVIIENPAGSLIWRARRLRRLLQHRSAQMITFDCCQFGAAWRKRTSLAAWHAVPLQSLAKRCSGCRGFCSASGQRHTILSGHSGGVHLTAQAAAYPPRFCNAVARLIEHSMISLSGRRLHDICVRTTAS